MAPLMADVEILIGRRSLPQEALHEEEGIAVVT
jgi:hypothetical protein